MVVAKCGNHLNGDGNDQWKEIMGTVEKLESRVYQSAKDLQDEVSRSISDKIESAIERLQVLTTDKIEEFDSTSQAAMEGLQATVEAELETVQDRLASLLSAEENYKTCLAASTTKMAKDCKTKLNKAEAINTKKNLEIREKIQAELDIANESIADLATEAYDRTSSFQDALQGKQDIINRLKQEAEEYNEELIDLMKELEEKSELIKDYAADKGNRRKQLRDAYQYARQLEELTKFKKRAIGNTVETGKIEWSRYFNAVQMQMKDETLRLRGMHTDERKERHKLEALHEIALQETKISNLNASARATALRLQVSREIQESKFQESSNELQKKQAELEAELERSRASESSLDNQIKELRNEITASNNSVQGYQESTTRLVSDLKAKQDELSNYDTEVRRFVDDLTLQNRKLKGTETRLREERKSVLKDINEIGRELPVQTRHVVGLRPRHASARLDDIKLQIEDWKTIIDLVETEAQESIAQSSTELSAAAKRAADALVEEQTKVANLNAVLATSEARVRYQNNTARTKIEAILRILFNRCKYATRVSRVVILLGVMFGAQSTLLPRRNASIAELNGKFTTQSKLHEQELYTLHTFARDLQTEITTLKSDLKLSTDKVIEMELALVLSDRQHAAIQKRTARNTLSAIAAILLHSKQIIIKDDIVDKYL
ncbi:hypothetical protein MMC27_003063 [Xylographa pallens]|nr:hypothetical protein [Xylographa pallens]